MITAVATFALTDAWTLDPALLLTLIGPAGAAGVLGAYLTWRVQSRQASAQKTASDAAREKVIGDLLDARTREFQALTAAIAADNATLRAELVVLRAENAEIRVRHERDMATMQAENAECRELTRALVMRLDELSAELAAAMAAAASPELSGDD